MSKLDKVKVKILKKIFSLAQESVEEINDGLSTDERTKSLCRQLAAEGCVLIKNEDVLPIKNEEKIAVFGRCQQDYFYVGYGSGGDVKAPYKISPMEAFNEAGVKYDEKLAEIYRDWAATNPPDDGVWGMWPMCYDEMPLTDDIVANAAKENDKAIVFIGRSSGEDREAKREAGSWYLTKEEEIMLSLVSAEFEKVCVVLNCGAIFDVSWVERYGIGAVLYAWQGGQESGNALCDVLTGKVNPSGKLADTIAPIECYPSTTEFGDKKLSIYNEDIYVGYRYFETFDKNSVIYPFGFGLSYTSFNVKGELVSGEDSNLKVRAYVENKGQVAGKEVVQVYMKAPEGALGKPSRELIAFAKTKEIEPGKKAQVTLDIDLREFASYDDTGLTGHKNTYLLEAGDYEIYLGTDVRSATLVGSVALDEIIVKETLEVCPPDRDFKRLAIHSGNKIEETVPKGTRDLRERVLKDIPLPMKYNKENYRFSDVKNGNVTMDDFVASLSKEELEVLSRGSLECMNSPYGAPGNAAVFGGTCSSLVAKGVPAITVNDGPSGVRLQAHATLFPIGAVLASSFDVELVEEALYEMGKEVKDRNSQALLAPGMNIHRNPLCGRNFEYFSEDPYLTGMMGTAYVKGVQKAYVGAVPKHVCCNNQETGRNTNNAVVSQRALREIYLRGFERCIKEAKPEFLMTSYNKINGVYSYYNYDLCTVLLRNEFGFEGLIMTDWWTKEGVSPEFPKIKNKAAIVRAGDNLFMPGADMFGKYKGKSDGSIMQALAADDGLSLGELQANAKRVLNYCLKW